MEQRVWIHETDAIASQLTGLQMMNVAPAWQYVLKAIVLILAILVDVYFKKKG
jgi:predicted ABC-type sugar transport system permease subunit